MGFYYYSIELIFPFFDRHILACLHFNENVHRETKRGKSGEMLLKVTYPKYKAGEELVRAIAVPATYGMFVNYCTKLQLL